MTARIVAVAVALLVVVGACGSDKSSSATAATTTTTTGTGGSAALCSARDDLKTSIQDLASVDVVKNGTSGLQAALTKVKDNLQAVKAAASADLQPQINNLQTALDQLGTAITNVSSGGIASVATAASNAAQAGTTLMTGLSNLTCD